MELTDEELMARFQAGDRDSFAILAGRYSGPLYGLANRYLGRREDAEEIRQEALLKAYSQAGKFRPDGLFRAWIYRITLNLCHDRNRRMRRLHWTSFGAGDEERQAAPTPRADGDEVLQQREETNRVRRALGGLPEEQRTVLVLKEYEEMKFREIADLLGCPESTVKSRLYRGLAALRRQLEDTGPAAPLRRLP